MSNDDLEKSKERLMRITDEAQVSDAEEAQLDELLRTIDVPATIQDSMQQIRKGEFIKGEDLDRLIEGAPQPEKKHHHRG